MSASGHWTLEEVMTENASSSKEAVVRSGMCLYTIPSAEFLTIAFAFPSPVSSRLPSLRPCVT